MSQFRIADALDILVIAVLIYHLLILTRETRAYQVLKGVGLLFIAALISDIFQIATLGWILNSVLTSGILVIVVLFQPEIRRTLEHLGRGKILSRSFFSRMQPEARQTVREIQAAVMRLAKRHVGALIVIEQQTKLGDVVSTGTRIEGAISAPLLENIFEPNTPLHDGAVVIREQMLLAAACFLPLSEETGISRELGTRHRAALGISSVSDSVTIVVSEETGVISFARDGKLVRYVDERALHTLLESLFVKENTASAMPIPLFGKKRSGEDGKGNA